MAADAKRKKWIFPLCWGTYVTAYLCRVNLASAMSKLEAAQCASAALLGVVGSSFFAVYAIGQLVNGWLGDRVPPYAFVGTAMAATAVLNLLISASSGFVPLLLLWSLNGYAQSMVWGPLMRILSQSHPPEHKARLSMGMSTSMVAGFLMSWVVFGQLFLDREWPVYFWLPALPAAVFAVVWLGMARSRRQPTPKPQAIASALAPTIRRDRLWLIALICLCMGLIKESLSLWAPVMFATMLGVDTRQSLLYIAIIPGANFVGILFSRFLLARFREHVPKALGLQFALACGCAALLLAAGGHLGVWAVLPIAVVSGTMYGCNSVLLSFIPMGYARHNLVSGLVGFFDFSSYVGAAVSSVLFGVVITSGHYTALFWVWLAAAAGALVLVALSAYRAPGMAPSSEP